MSHSFKYQIIFVLAALVIIIAGMKQAADLITPFLLAIFLAAITFPVMHRLNQKGLPKTLSLLVVMLLIFLVGVALALLIGNSLNDFSVSLPEYKARISSQWAGLLIWLDNHGVSLKNVVGEVLDPSAAVTFVSTIFKSFGNLLAQSFLILLTVAFILMEVEGLSGKVVKKQGINTNSYNDFGDKLRHYMSIKTAISLATGIIIGVALWLLDVEYPVLWGVLAFMLNFIPTIGSIIAAVPVVILVLLQQGPLFALLVTGLYSMVNIVIGNVVEPRYMGKAFGLSTLLVFISLVFWGWVLGPVGMLLSVPLTIAVKLAFDSNPDTLWLGELLGPVENDIDMK